MIKDPLPPFQSRELLHQKDVDGNAAGSGVWVHTRPARPSLPGCRRHVAAALQFE